MSFLSITCPYCWEAIEIEDPAAQDQPVEFVADCEVCCRPIRVFARPAEDGGEPEIDVAPDE